MNSMLTNDYLYGTYRNMTFCDIFPDYNSFSQEYEASPLKNMGDSVEQLYYLLYARYGNSPIANADVNQFKYRLFGIMFSYGPTWEKKLDIQRRVRELSIEELEIGSKAIYNKAFNPGTEPSSQSLEELRYINEQTTTGCKKSKAESLAIQYGLLETTVTEQFLNRFKQLFLTFVSPELPLLYGD